MKKASIQTQQAFILAAGELFAARGVDSVSIREIAAVAGVDSSMIKYHFGNKEGLVNAVADYAVRPWQDSNLPAYFQENESLLDTHDGQVIFVTGMAETIFNMFNTGKEEKWAKSFILKLLQYPTPLRKKIIDKHMTDGVRTFAEVYRRITGNDDFETAFCWYLFMICPIYLYSGMPEMINLFHANGQVAPGFERRLLHFSTQQMLIGFHLI